VIPPGDNRLLAGLRVVEFAHVIAGPMAGTMLADLGAEVLHVEAPNLGDSSRHSGPAKDGVHLWWKVLARNKRSITLDLRVPEGQAIARDLVAKADVVITNLRAETLDGWGLDYQTLQTVNPKLVYLQVTAFGARGSQKNAPGFGKVGEARSGVVYVTGFPDTPPVHVGFSHGDATTALMGAFSIMAALHRKNQDPNFNGEWVDLALFETLYRLCEWQPIIYDQLGIVPERAGNRLAVSPAAVINAYLSRDNQWITVTSAHLKSVLGVVKLLGLPAEKYQTRQQQDADSEFLNDQLKQWVACHDADECLEAMAQVGVTASRIYSIKDIFEDPIYEELGDVLTVEDRQLGPVRMPGVIPRMVNHPGNVWRTGPELGEDNELVYSSWLGLSGSELASLHASGTI
jgi:crotonobetainyl-CoA:carnitine CoA-transferase CaiB-like acyl-CoA transferase